MKQRRIREMEERKMMVYARFICDLLDRRDVLDERCILDRIESLEKMRKLASRVIERDPALQSEVIMEDIDLISEGRI